MWRHLHWGPASGSTKTTPDLYLEEAIAAARRGVKVRILLSDAFLDPNDPKDNTKTMAYVNDTARREGLDLQARIIKSSLAGLDKIHNKGVVVDGRRALVSSVNWSLNSPLNNREVSLLIDNQQIAGYFTDVFTYDWYNGQPADYPLITEVDPATGFVEISNFTSKAVDLSGWNLVTSTGTVPLPAGLNIQPGKAVVIARDARTYRAKYGGAPAPTELKGLALGADRDFVKLQKAQTPVDMVAWGAAIPGWTLPGRAPLCRPTAGKDTNTYLDWTQGAQGSPGTPGCAAK